MASVDDPSGAAGPARGAIARSRRALERLIKLTTTVAGEGNQSTAMALEMVAETIGDTLIEMEQVLEAKEELERENAALRTQLAEKGAGAPRTVSPTAPSRQQREAAQALQTYEALVAERDEEIQRLRGLLQAAAAPEGSSGVDGPKAPTPALAPGAAAPAAPAPAPAAALPAASEELSVAPASAGGASSSREGADAGKGDKAGAGSGGRVADPVAADWAAAYAEATPQAEAAFERFLDRGLREDIEGEMPMPPERLAELVEAIRGEQQAWLETKVREPAARAIAIRHFDRLVNADMELLKELNESAIVGAASAATKDGAEAFAKAIPRAEMAFRSFVAAWWREELVDKVPMPPERLIELLETIRGEQQAWLETKVPKRDARAIAIRHFDRLLNADMELLKEMNESAKPAAGKGGGSGNVPLTLHPGRPKRERPSYPYADESDDEEEDEEEKSIWEGLEQRREEAAATGLSALASAAAAGGEDDGTVASAASSKAHYLRSVYGRSVSGRSAAVPAPGPVEQQLLQEAEARGYKFSAPIFFEKLALAGFAPSPIPDMAAFRAALRRPEVQAAYRADYERCNSNGKRGAILKICELAGVDTKLVKMERKYKRLKAAKMAAAAAAASAPPSLAPGATGDSAVMSRMMREMPVGFPAPGPFFAFAPAFSDVAAAAKSPQCI